ncbi:MAG: 16S rRNA processing protein RimM [Chloroflexi bacterium]|jgi:16S rRNA processing protein RimM|nr:16S rRNA processing protein RimM [Chloroflexota bacterium]
MPLRFGNDAGSDRNAEPAFLVLGKLRRAHGISGELTLEVYTRMPELLDAGQVIFIGETYQAFTIQSTRPKGKLLLLKFAEIKDRTEASALTNQLVYTKSEHLPSLPEDDFYLHELIGLDVFDTDDNHLGVLTEILETGANDVYLVRDSAGVEVLIAAVEEQILEIDLEQGRMTVLIIPWYGEGA